MSIYPIQPSFAAGELTPSLWGRVDMAKYSVGLKVCENFVIHPHGGVSRRPGTHYVANAAGPCRLVPFIYNESVAYVVEISAGLMRFFRDGELVGSLSGVPYSLEEIWELSFAQSADVLYICHKSHPPLELARYSDSVWTLTACRLAAGFLGKDLSCLQNMSRPWTCSCSENWIISKRLPRKTGASKPDV